MCELRDLQAKIQTTRAERGFTTDPVRMLTLLVEEVGEVAGELKRTWSINYSDLEVDHLGDELADVLVLVSAIASQFEIDLEDAVQRKFFTADSQRTWATAANHVSD